MDLGHLNTLITEKDILSLFALKYPLLRGFATFLSNKKFRFGNLYILKSFEYLDKLTLIQCHSAYLDKNTLYLTDTKDTLGWKWTLFR